MAIYILFDESKKGREPICKLKEDDIKNTKLTKELKELSSQLKAFNLTCGIKIKTISEEYFDNLNNYRLSQRIPPITELDLQIIIDELKKQLTLCEQTMSSDKNTPQISS